jgi:hypothetical protein
MLRAFMMRVKASSQNVQVFGFIRLGLKPTMRYGIERGPRNITGRCKFCQHPLQIAEWCWFIEALPPKWSPLLPSQTVAKTRGNPVWFAGVE